LEGREDRRGGRFHIGYTFKRNNEDETHIKNTCKMATAAIVQIWEKKLEKENLEEISDAEC